ncbi:MAG: sugar phosphate isomerase/epimerase [Anaerolineaceae bacterium]|jgi:D-psicose/D-tagatose/L-ribulose 3-epimerase|nr:MAG: sugar phosphate isomerase/epimerase [Anaerolineaceae bacterium]
MNNKVGIYYAFWTREWDVPFYPYIDKAQDLGFDILEVNSGTIAKMSTVERQKLREHAQSRQIELSYCIGLPANFDIASPDMSTRKKGIEFLTNQILGIGEMGGGYLSGILYGAWPATMPKGRMMRQDYLSLSIDSISQVTKAAEENEVVLCMEIVNRFEQFLLNTAEEGVAYCQTINSPNVKILLDTFHMNIEEDSITSAVLIAGKYLGHVHLGENHRMPPGCGHGHIPWNELMVSLKKINYHGSLVMEPFLVPGGQVGQDIKIWRDQSKGFILDEEAQKACAFIKQKLMEAN